MWTDAFEQLEGLLRGAGGRAGYVDLYFRVLGALDEEVVSYHVDRTREEVEHNSLIKVRVGGLAKVATCRFAIVLNSSVCV